MRLSTRLSLTSLLLVLGTALAIGGIALWSLLGLGRELSQLAGDTLRDQGIAALRTGAVNDRIGIDALVHNAEADASKLAASGNLATFQRSRTGRNQLWNEMIRTEAQRVAEGLVRLCTTHHASLEKTISRNLAVAWQVFTDAGGMKPTEATATWQATDQFSKAVTPVTLPVLVVGTQPLRPGQEQAARMPVVDAVTSLVGGTCTIFQRLNERGDMLRIATNVRTADGKRAIGTYIPAVMADGNPNQVVTTVLDGRTFTGRAQVVGHWSITAYQPITGAAGVVIGMLYVGVREQEESVLLDTITATRIGRCDAAVVVDGSGRIVAAADKALVDKPYPWREALAGKDQTVRHATIKDGGRERLVVSASFPTWDWTIAASGWLDEMSRVATDDLQRLVLGDLIRTWELSTVHAGTTDHHTLATLAILDANGQELLAVVDGKPASVPAHAADQAWFAATKGLAAEQVHIAPLAQDDRCGRVVLRIAAPVHIDGTFSGAVVLGLDWQVTRTLFAQRTYGKTGYPYIVNVDGILVTHPKYQLKDRFSIADPANGEELARIVRERMAKGDEGSARYTFQGVDKFVAFSPLTLGAQRFSVAATVPTEEIFALARTIESTSTSSTRSATILLAIVVAALVAVATTAGLLVSRSIARPVQTAIRSLSSGADQVTSAADQVSRSSQELSKGASTEAASIEETSASLEELTANIRQTAENTRAADRLAHSVNGTARQGADAAQQVAAETAQRLAQVGEVVKAIRVSTEQTTRVVETIDEIAFQTNLLALNAAVEAARAGEAGMGFAVVADEVRSLAGRSAEEVKNTAALIAEARTNAERMLTVTGEMDTFLRQAMDQRMLASFRQVVEASDKMAHLMSDLTTASDEQAKGVEQISRAIADMDRVTQGTAATAEEAAAASEELSSQAVEMHQTVQELVRMVEGRTEG